MSLTNSFGEYKLFSPNGELKEICNYIDDKLNGEFKSYYENWQIYIICNYIDDIKNGSYKSYHENGCELSYNSDNSKHKNLSTTDSFWQLK